MNPRSIDERMEAITQILEIVSHRQQKSWERIERLEKLADRLNRAFAAGLQEYFSNNGDGEGNGGER